MGHLPFPVESSRILAATEDAASSAILHTIARDLGAHLQILDAGKKLLALARNTLPDLLILDARLTSFGGAGYCGLGEEAPLLDKIPMLVTIPADAAHRITEALDGGASDILPEPLLKAEVKARILNHLELAWLRRRLEQTEGTDPVTSLANRKRFEAILDQEWLRTNRNSVPIAVIAASMDDFDDYAEAMGECAGNACLAALGQALSEAVERAGDIMARYDRDVFICALPDTDVPGALAVVQKMRANVGNLRLPGTKGPVTLSCGFTAAFTTQLLDPAELVFRALRNLAQASAKGGNRWSSGEE